MAIINPEDMDTVIGILTDQQRLYFVPSFQRPYAWKAKQVDDLMHDMRKAYNFEGSHYLAAFHFLDYDPANGEHPLANFAQHAQGILAQGLQAGQLMTAAGAVDILAVIDGQQRLTTLFLLAHLLYYHLHLDNPLFHRHVFEVQPLGGHAIPRLILGNSGDHGFMMGLVNCAWNPNDPLPQPSNAAQTRMKESFEKMRGWFAQGDWDWVNFFTSTHFRVLRAKLDLDYGLTAFMTLNDRGIDLTILEKLKALLMQFVYDASRAHEPEADDLIDVLHHVFGALYLVIDRCIHVGLFSESKADDDAVKLISCYLRLDTDGAAIWQGPDQAYENFFRQILLDAAVADIPGIVQPWCNRLRELADQLGHLLECINGAVDGAVPSLHFDGFLLKDDYHATVISLGLQPHLLALLLRFRSQFHAEWHQRFPVTPNPFPMPIHELLDNIAARARGIDPAPPQALFDYISHLREAECAPRLELSMIEIVERMQLVNWNMGHRWYAGFRDTSNTMGQLPQAQDGINLWLGWCSCNGFVSDILDSPKDPNIRYLLKEMERKLTAHHNLHRRPLPNNISTGAITLEHIFAQNIHAPQNQGFPGFQAYLIADFTEFVQKVLWRSGNFTWLSEAAGIALGNQPPHIKAAHYQNCPGHPAGGATNVCSDILITHEAGGLMVQLGLHHPSFRFYIEARCAELALFAVRRFC
ncbi:MAG: DUF262 domain-containing protein [Lamprocystis purpurea]|jgi:hypothetical protein|uniref:DUF262 domain-containing protein n=1 Tax=Lamprocystis purpurea TaxID=61598 RepID=UPI00037ECC89|nr:DUF262 domain-containing protein [Lamprocystis purpurea]MBV5274791.1 DUF262 domain-containing protein [Lamprocystis purpurea]